MNSREQTVVEVADAIARELELRPLSELCAEDRDFYLEVAQRALDVVLAAISAVGASS